MNSHLAIIPVEAGPVATVGYLVLDTQAAKAAVVDVPHGSAHIFMQLAGEHGVEIAAIWLTHSHWDHTADAAEIVRQTNAEVFIHRADEYRLFDPMKHSIWPLPFSIEPVLATGYFHDGDIITMGDWTFEILHTPGHTEGGVCLVDKKHSIALVGDTLFAGSIGRTDLPGGDTNTLLQSINNSLLTLDDDINILPGHGPASTIGTERKHNPFLAVE